MSRKWWILGGVTVAVTVVAIVMLLVVPPRPTTVFVTFDSTPRGAEVTLNGQKLLEPTPIRNYQLEVAGPIDVRMSKDGYTSAETWSREALLTNATILMQLGHEPEPTATPIPIVEATPAEIASRSVPPTKKIGSMIGRAKGGSGTTGHRIIATPTPSPKSDEEDLSPIPTPDPKLRLAYLELDDARRDAERAKQWKQVVEIATQQLEHETRGRNPSLYYARANAYYELGRGREDFHACVRDVVEAYPLFANIAETEAGDIQCQKWKAKTLEIACMAGYRARSPGRKDGTFDESQLEAKLSTLQNELGSYGDTDIRNRACYDRIVNWTRQLDQTIASAGKSR